MGAPEDAATGRPARPGGTRLHCERSSITPSAVGTSWVRFLRPWLATDLRPRRSWLERRQHRDSTDSLLTHASHEPLGSTMRFARSRLDVNGRGWDRTGRE